MPIKWTTYKPAEAAHASGTTTALQGLWRHRGVLPKRDEPGWSKIDAAEVCTLIALKALSSAGISNEMMRRLSWNMAREILSSLVRLSGAVDGCDPERVAPLPKEEMRPLLFVMLPERPALTDVPGPLPYRFFNNFERMRGFVGQDSDALGAAFFDCEALAYQVYKALPKPVARWVDADEAAE